MQKPDICIYHGHCPDGFTSAWAIWKRFGDEIEYRHGSYGAGMPTVDGKHVLMVDFSYKRPEMVEIIHKAASVTILDHHISAYYDIGDLVKSGIVHGKFDMEKSGARLAWEWANPDTEVPLLVQVIEDRDLWRFDNPMTESLCAYADLHEQTFQSWSKLAESLDDLGGLTHALTLGGALVDKFNQDCDRLIATTLRWTTIAGHRVPICNVPHIYSSKVGNLLMERLNPPFSASFYIDKTGERVFSLRSTNDNVNVSEIAVQFGGGGHRNASGFRKPGDWDGDELHVVTLNASDICSLNATDILPGSIPASMIASAGVITININAPQDNDGSILK